MRTPGEGYPVEKRTEALALIGELGSCRKAAKVLGIHYQTLHRWVRAERNKKSERGMHWRCPCSPYQIQTQLDCRGCSCRCPAVF